MEVVLASLAFCAASLACVDRLVRASRAWTALPAAGLLVAAWVALWLARLPPTPGHALLAFTLADLAVLVIATVSVVRLLGGFEAQQPPPGGDDPQGGDPEPVEPPPHPPHRNAIAGRRSPRPSRPISGSRRSATRSGTRGSSRSWSDRTG